MSTGKGLVLSGTRQSFSGFLASCVKIRWRGGTAGLALVPEVAQTSQSSSRSSRLNCQSRIASRTISLVVAYSPVSTAALRRQSAPRQGDADFFNIGHGGTSARHGALFATSCLSIANIYRHRLSSADLMEPCGSSSSF